MLNILFEVPILNQHPYPYIVYTCVDKKEFIKEKILRILDFIPMGQNGKLYIFVYMHRYVRIVFELKIHLLSFT